MQTRSRHLSVHVDRPPGEVYAFAVEPTNLPVWASGLGSSVEQVDGSWYVEAPVGRLQVRFAPRNDLGVLDHDVTLPTGEVVRNPMRVLPDGAGSEVVFTLRPGPGMNEQDLERDAAAITKDLESLRSVLEGRRR